MSDQLMFPLPGQKMRKVAVRGISPSTARWSTYTAVHREKCNDCLLECGANSAAPAANLARRRFRVGDVDLLLCHTHAVARGDSFDPKNRSRKRRGGGSA